MATAMVAEYQSPEVNDPVPQPEVTGSHASARLGPFYVPRGVVLSVGARDRCAFELAYENDEPAEREPRRVGNRETFVVLGRRSRKILSVLLDGASAVLARRERILDPDVSRNWLHELTADRRFACAQNAVVVSLVLDAMPDDVRATVLAKLKELGTS